MANDKATLISSLTSYFSNVDPNSTPASKASDLADILETWVKTFTIDTGSLSTSVTTTGVGNLGLPVSSSGSGTNTNGGSLV